jgi:hypothetical protein
LYNKASAIAAISKGVYPELPLLPFKQTNPSIREVADTLISIMRANPTKVNLQLARSVLATAINEQGFGANIKGFNYNFFGIQSDIGKRWHLGPIFTNISLAGQVIALEGSTKNYRAYLAFSTLKDTLEFTLDAHQRKHFDTEVSLRANDSMEYAKVYTNRWYNNGPQSQSFIVSKSAAYVKAKQYIY